MLSAIGKSISFKYQDQTTEVLKDISFSITPQSAIGLLGPNGSGKSTLLKILQGILKPLSGTLVRSPEMNIGFLPQSLETSDPMSVYDYLWQTSPDLYRLKIGMEALGENSSEADWEIIDAFEAAGGYDFEVQIKKKAEVVGLEHSLLGRTITTLSGGERTKVGILGLLIHNPHLLLLDEPTNHLDISMLAWLQSFLKSIATPYIIVSHDRGLLEHSVSEIWELKAGHLKIYSGNYQFYRNTLQEEKARQLEAFAQHKDKVKQLQRAAQKRRVDAHRMENFKASRSIKKNGGLCKQDEGSGSAAANPNKKMRSAKAIESRIMAMIDDEQAKKPFIEKERTIALPTSSSCMSKRVIQIDSLSLHYGNRTIFSDLSLDVLRGERLAIVGKNGSGKTSFLRALSGQVDCDHGFINWSPTAHTAFFYQDNIDLNHESSVLKEVWHPELVEQHLARTVLGSLGLEKEKAFQSIATLSPGERVKVALAKTILSGANTLLLDEPTNHLEITAKEMLEQALLAYQGTLIFISHDLVFIKAIASRVFDLSQNKIFEQPQDWIAQTPFTNVP